MSRHEKKILQFPGQMPVKTIRLRHTFEVFDEFSRGDVDTGERAVHRLNAAQMRNTREIISQSLKSVGRKSRIYALTSEVDSDTYAEYDRTIGMTQRSPDGEIFVATEVRTDAGGKKELISLALTTKLRREVDAILGVPQSQDEDLAA